VDQEIANMEREVAQDGHSPQRRGRPRKQIETASTGKMHPRDERHPEHEAWIGKMREVNLKRWAEMPTKARNELRTKIEAGKKKKLRGMSWQNMTSQQRSAEMMRRKAVAEGRAPSKNMRPYQRKKIAAKQAAKPNAAKPNGAVHGAVQA
jgi:hypothetical protein